MELIWAGLLVVAIIAALVVIGKINVAKNSKCKACGKSYDIKRDYS